MIVDEKYTDLSSIDQATKAVCESVKQFIQTGENSNEFISKVLSLDACLNLVPIKWTPENLSSQISRTGKKITQVIAPRVNELENLLNSQVFREQILRTLPKSDLEISISEKLDNMQYRNNECSINLQDPRLLYECSCKVPDDFANREFSCRIHKQSMASMISNALQGSYVRIVFNGIEIFWKNFDTLWPPTIDSLFMMQCLNEHGYTTRNLSSVIDIGCGTGFLGLLLAKMNKSISTVYLGDLFITPLFLGIMNISANFGMSENPTFKLVHSDGLRRFKGQKYDLVICNPPYLPLLGVPEFTQINSVVGTQLLESTIMECSKLSSELIIGCSSLSLPEFHSAVKKAGANARQLGKIQVPFNVFHALLNSKYMSVLMQTRQNSIIIRKDNPFKLWHYFTVWSVTY